MGINGKNWKHLLFANKSLYIWGCSHAIGDMDDTDSCTLAAKKATRSSLVDKQQQKSSHRGKSRVNKK
jgi:hypothetical protein